MFPNLLQLSSTSVLYLILHSLCRDYRSTGVLGQFFLPNHPFIPPFDTSLEDSEYHMTFSSQRGPCPGLNTLANHGYINRNGSDISLRDVADAAEVVFGFPRLIVLRVGVLFLSMGIPTTAPPSRMNDEEKASIRFNLFDMYTHNAGEHDASLVREDHHFDEFAQFNVTLFEQLIANAVNGTLALDAIIQHMMNRIIDSRIRNPYVSFDHNPFLAQQLGAEALLLLALGDDPDFKVVRTDFLRIFLEENRIPDDFVPHSMNDFPYISSKEPTNVLDSFQNASVNAHEAITIMIPLDEYSSPMKDAPPSTLLIIFLCIGLILLLALIYLLLLPRKKQVKRFIAFVLQEIPNKMQHLLCCSQLFCIKDTSLKQEEDLGTSEVFHDDNEAATGKTWKRSHTIFLSNPNVKISWSNLSAYPGNENRRRNNNTSPNILQDLSGFALAGHLTCILGHSGSGKSTLLNVLGGRLGSGVTLDGIVCIDGIPIKRNSQRLSTKNVAFVRQTDTLHSWMTPWEAIRLSARLRLPRDLTEAEIEDIVNKVINELRLDHVQNICMDDKNGLSGGEKRRVSFAIELVTNPSILLLDEVTSGLDSHSAFTVVQVCEQIASTRNVAVLMAIHQPSSKIFSIMHHVILLHSGECMFHGEAEKMSDYFTEHGFAPPQGYSIPEWALEVSQMELRTTLNDHGFFNNNSENWCMEVCHLESNSRVIVHESSCEEQRTLIYTEIKELLVRDIITSLRDHTMMSLRYGTISFLSCLTAICFWNVASVPENPESFTSHVGVVFHLTFSCIIISIISITEGINDRAIFVQEYSRRYYRVTSYALTRVYNDIVTTFVCAIVYLCIVYWAIHIHGRFWAWFSVIFVYALYSDAIGRFIAAIPNDALKAHLYVPLITTPQILLTGFFVAYDSLPPWIRWMSWSQPLTYVFRLLLNEEFSPCLTLTATERHTISCAKALERKIDMNAQKGPVALYNNESVLTLLQAGQYNGTDDILDYLQFSSPTKNEFAMLWNFCELENTQTLEINQVDDTSCDVTVTAVATAEVNSKFLKKDLDAYFSYDFVFGRRLRFRHDILDTAIVGENIFLPPDLIDDVYMNELNSVAMSTETCLLQESICPEYFKYNNYSDILDCVEKFETLPIVSESDAGLRTVDGNSTGCRNLHASMTVLNPDIHCAHLSFYPMADPKGKVKCSNSSNFALDNYFSDNDVLLFKQAALASGIESNIYYSKLPLSQEVQSSRKCRVDLVETRAIQRGINLPNQHVCYSYLETQKANGDLNWMYWVLLIIHSVLIRLLTFFILQWRATKC